VHPLTLLSALYGQGRGYHRLDIRRRVAANERLSREALARAGDDAFQHHVRRSIDRFPLYAERVKAHRGSHSAPGRDIRPAELPVWTRANQREFFAQQPRPEDSHYVRESSGSTGIPVHFHVTRESYEWRTAIMDRSYSWAGAEEGAKSLHVWGMDLKARPLKQRIKRLLHTSLQRRVYVEAYQSFTDAERAACCTLINRVKPHAVVGYTGMLVDVARYARDHGALTWKPRTMVSAAEGLRCGQRELLEHHLVDEVFHSYGSREFMNIGMECEKHTGYHIASDNLRVEVVDDTGQPVPAGEEGRIVITDFHNAATPFVRYEVGDIGVMALSDEACPCGRPFPLLKSVDGRMQDVIQTPNGPITAIYFTFTTQQFIWIEGFQVVQHAKSRVLLRLLTRAELTPERLAPLETKLRAKLGEMTIDYERVDELSRRRSGKVELVISTLAADT